MSQIYFLMKYEIEITKKYINKTEYILYNLQNCLQLDVITFIKHKRLVLHFNKKRTRYISLLNKQNNNHEYDIYCFNEKLFNISIVYALIIIYLF